MKASASITAESSYGHTLVKIPVNFSMISLISFYKNRPTEIMKFDDNIWPIKLTVTLPSGHTESWTEEKPSLEEMLSDNEGEN